MEAMTVTALDLLRRSARGIILSEKIVAVAYSGGLDSSILAAISRELTNVRCYTCVVSGSFDDLNVRGRADSESMDLTLIELKADALPSQVRDASRVLGSSNPIQIAYSIPIISVLRESRERLVLAGSGADELFGGYAKYAAARDPSNLMKEDLDKMLLEAEHLKKAARSAGKELGFPFVSDELISFSRSLPIDRKITESVRKVLLREVARELGLPSYSLPKKAAQYSSGVLRQMEKLAKAEGRSLAEWTRRAAGDDGRSS